MSLKGRGGRLNKLKHGKHAKPIDTSVHKKAGRKSGARRARWLKEKA